MLWRKFVLCIIVSSQYLKNAKYTSKPIPKDKLTLGSHLHSYFFFVTGTVPDPLHKEHQTCLTAFHHGVGHFTEKNSCATFSAFFDGYYDGGS